VLADLDTLATLPEREMRAGYAEVIKYGILGDRDFFVWCEAHGPAVVAGGHAALEYAVTHSVAAKARVIAEDERETTGARALLNLGHTFGHALEAQTGFSDRLLHGEGVALGMVLAARYSTRRGHIADDDAARVTAAIDAAGLPSEIAALGLNADGRALAAHMLHDKKMNAGTLPFVLLRGIGEAFLDKQVSLEDVADFLDEELQAH
jgi:3-dehydroquinate synthase